MTSVDGLSGPGATTVPSALTPSQMGGTGVREHPQSVQYGILSATGHDITPAAISTAE